MDPAAQRQFYNDMSGRELADFKKNYSFAVSQGWVSLPKRMPAPAPTPAPSTPAPTLRAPTAAEQQRLLDWSRRRPVLSSPW